MFKIAPAPEFTHKVPVLVPVDGGHREEVLSVRYRVIPSEQMEAFDGRNTEEFKVYLRSIVVSLNDLVDAADKPVAYTDQVREVVFDLPYARLAIARAYSAALTKARLGN